MKPDWIIQAANDILSDPRPTTHRQVVDIIESNYKRTGSAWEQRVARANEELFPMELASCSKCTYSRLVPAQLPFDKETHNQRMESSDDD